MYQNLSGIGNEKTSEDYMAIDDNLFFLFVTRN